MSRREITLERKQPEEDIFSLLNQSVTFRIKFYIIIALGMLMFLALCFLVQHETYGLLVW